MEAVLLRAIVGLSLFVGAWGALSSCAANAQGSVGYQHYTAGDIVSERLREPEPGLLLIGGGDWSREAWHWFVKKSGNGHIVIIRASQDGSDGQWIVDEIGGVASVHTLVFSERSAAFEQPVIELLNRADAIFIAGGDQSNYVRFWKDTPVEDALNAHMAAGRPLGGTSAGLAILGGAGYGAMAPVAVDSPVALSDPHGPLVTLVRDFIDAPLLEHVITDTHFSERSRLGRLIAFVAQSRSGPDPDAVGLGVDEDTSLIVEPGGSARLYSTSGGEAWLVRPQGAPSFASDGALTWRDVDLTGIGPESLLNLNTFEVDDPAFRRVGHVTDGVLSVSEPMED